MRHLFRRLLFWLSWPGLFVYFLIGRRSRVLIRDGDKTLLVRGRLSLWYDDTRWGLPGGGIRRGEEPVNAALRELHEELGLTITPAACKPVGTAQVRELGFHYVMHFFVVEISQSTPLTVQDSEIAEVAWLNIQDLPSHSLHAEVDQILTAWSESEALLQ